MGLSAWRCENDLWGPSILIFGVDQSHQYGPKDARREMFGRDSEVSALPAPTDLEQERKDKVRYEFNRAKLRQLVRQQASCFMYIESLKNCDDLLDCIGILAPRLGKKAPEFINPQMSDFSDSMARFHDVT
jgi:hypothetical protein